MVSSDIYRTTLVNLETSVWMARRTHCANSSLARNARVLNPLFLYAACPRPYHQPVTARPPRQRRRRAAAPAPALPRPSPEAGAGFREPAPLARRSPVHHREHHVTTDYSHVPRDLLLVLFVGSTVLGFIIAMSFVL